MRAAVTTSQPLVLGMLTTVIIACTTVPLLAADSTKLITLSPVSRGGNGGEVATDEVATDEVATGEVATEAVRTGATTDTMRYRD